MIIWRRASWLAVPRFAVFVVVLGLVATACASGFAATVTSRVPASTNQVAASTKTITFNGVRVTIPSRWPVIDGAHTRYSCSATFLLQADRAFLGASYQGAHSCGAQLPHTTSPPADGLWMQPGTLTPPQVAPTVLPGGQRVYFLAYAPSSLAVTVWYHRVSIQIGIGANPAVERAILGSISYRSNSSNSPVLGRCPSPDPTPPTMPAPTRLTTPLTLDDSNGHLQPEPPSIQPRVSANTAWTSLFHDFGAGGFQGALQWRIVFGSYSAQTPAEMHPDGSTTPDYQHVPTWLIQGKGVQTDYGPCGITVLAPFDASTGHAMGVTTLG